jgi:Ricin-type beta-trefoil lectin domain
MFAGPMACSIYDEGLGEPRDSGRRDGVGGAAGRSGSIGGSAGWGSSDAEAGKEDAGTVDVGGSGGTGGAPRNDASQDSPTSDGNRVDTTSQPDGDAMVPDAPFVDTGPDVGGDATDVAADRDAGLPDADASRGDVSIGDAMTDLNPGIDADPDRRGATPDGGPIVGIVYNIVARHSGKCMTVLGNLPFDGTNIVQFVCDGSASQRFRLQAVTPSSYVIVHAASGSCVDIDGSGTADGTNVALYTCNNTAAQVYALTPTENSGFYTMVNPNSGKCVDVDSARQADLANIQIFTCNGGPNQSWEFVPPP